MGPKLKCVSGLMYSVTKAEVERLFAEHGNVEASRAVTDKYTGQSCKFDFVEMSSLSEAEAAIAAQYSSELDGRALTENEAKPIGPPLS